MGTFAFDPHFQFGKHKITAQCRFPTVFRNCNCKTGKQRTIVHCRQLVGHIRHPDVQNDQLVVYSDK